MTKLRRDMSSNDLALERLENERDALRRELRGVQEMLAFVLHEVGEPVTVTKSDLKTGLPDGAEIRIDEDLEGETFTFSLAVPVSEQ